MSSRLWESLQGKFFFYTWVRACSRDDLRAEQEEFLLPKCEKGAHAAVKATHAAAYRLGREEAPLCLENFSVNVITQTCQLLLRKIGRRHFGGVTNVH